MSILHFHTSPHCFQLKPFASILAKRKEFTSLDHLMLDKKKYDLLLEVLEVGYNIAFTVRKKIFFFFFFWFK